MIQRPKHLVAKLVNSVAKSVSHRNSDGNNRVTKALVAKSFVTEFIFGRYLETEIFTHKNNKFGHCVFGCYFAWDPFCN